MKVSEAVIKTGIVDENIVAEFTRWGVPLEVSGEGFINSVEAALAAINEALEGRDAVRVRQTDLNVLKQYLHTQKKGKLYIITEDTKGTINVVFGRTSPGGEYIIPWRAESLDDILTNGLTYLVDDKKKVYFSSVKELYFGDVKSFIICTPSVREDHANKEG